MTRRAQYQAGITHGHRLAQDHNVDHEPALRLEVRLTDGGPGRARALGELRGYRQATGRPYVEGHSVLTAGETLHQIVRARWEGERWLK